MDIQEGGLGIILLLRERPTDNEISDCQFFKNTAVYDGGMHALFGYCHEITHSWFETDSLKGI